MFSINKSLSKLKAIKKLNKNKGTEENGAEINVNKKLSVVKTSKNQRKRKRPKGKFASNESKKLEAGVVMLKNIPHGFYEKQMIQFFSQFGKITRIRLSRSRKTGKSRKYAYIEFQCDEVAKIVADTMNNYLMFDHILKCEFIPPEKMPPKLFRRWNKPFISTSTIHKNLHNKDKTFDRELKLMKKRIKSVKQMENKLSEMGIEFKCEIVNKPTRPLTDSSVKEKLTIDSSDKNSFKAPSNSVHVAKKKARKQAAHVLTLQQIKVKPIKHKRMKPIKLAKMSLLPKFSILRAATKRKYV